MPKADSGGGGADTQAPKVVISSPAANADVAASSTVVVTATDDRGVARVDVQVDGKLQASKTAAPYEFPLIMAAGTHQLTAIAVDAAGNQGQALITVNVKGGAPSTDSGVAPDPTPAPGSFGAPCASSADCTSKLCVQDQATQGKYCSQRCDQTSPCPVSADCLQATDTSFICGLKAKTNPATDSSVGSCSLGSGASFAGLISLLAIVLPALLLLIAGRRRDQA